MCPDGNSPVTITDRTCPGGTGRSGDFAKSRLLKAGCCYLLKDPGDDGKGGPGTYVNAATNNTYKCTYTLTVGEKLGKAAAL